MTEEVLVSGSREFSDLQLMADKLDHILSRLTDVVLVTGACRSFDELVARYGALRGIAVEKVDKRNAMSTKRTMVHRCDRAVFFYKGQSRGTHLLHAEARVAGLQVRVVVADA